MSNVESSNTLNSESSILNQAFGIDSLMPFFIQIPNEGTSVNIDQINLAEGVIFGGYKNSIGAGEVKIDIATLSPVGSMEDGAFTGVMIVSDTEYEANSYYITSYKYNKQTDYMELVDSALLGHGISIDAYEPSNDLIHIELTKKTSDLNKSDFVSERLSILACISKGYTIDLLQDRIHD